MNLEKKKTPRRRGGDVVLVLLRFEGEKEHPLAVNRRRSSFRGKWRRHVPWGAKKVFVEMLDRGFL